MHYSCATWLLRLLLFAYAVEGIIEQRKYRLVGRDAVFDAPVSNDIIVPSVASCATLCSSDPVCLAYNTRCSSDGEIQCSTLSNFARDPSVLVTNSGGRYYQSVAPQPVGGPIEPTNFVGGDWMNVFVDLAAPTAGTIAAWSFYAMNTGEFYAAVWRPLGSWNFRIIGKNKLAIDTLGKQHQTIPFSERISVLPGDVIGVHYGTITDCTDGCGVLAYSDSGHLPLCCGLTVASLNQFISIKLDNAAVAIGSIYTFDPTLYIDLGLFRTPALVMHVEE